MALNPPSVDYVPMAAMVLAVPWYSCAHECVAVPAAVAPPRTETFVTNSRHGATRHHGDNIAPSAHRGTAGSSAVSIVFPEKWRLHGTQCGSKLAAAVRQSAPRPPGCYLIDCLGDRSLVHPRLQASDRHCP